VLSFSSEVKASDYIAQFLVEQGVKHTFGITGGCIVHTLDSLAKRDDIKHIPVKHEQAAAMAADAYSRVTNNIGVALTTSGPGATNLLTGTCCSYYDSIPIISITGQVPTGQLKRDSKSRQIGFQETDVANIFKFVTKYSSLVDTPDTLRYELEKAAYLARSGRPGPVLIDICDDIQRADINPENLKSFTPPAEEVSSQDLEARIQQSLDLIKNSKRPVVILGGGIRAGGAIEKAKYFVNKLGFPVAPTWGAMDYIPYDHPLMVGSFGVSSERAGNFVVQNSDLVIALGTRLDTHEIGPNAKTFARGAKKIVLDIDESELDKYKKLGLEVDVPICEDINRFFDKINPQLKDFEKIDLREWFNYVERVKTKYPICLPEYADQTENVNPYVFMRELSRQSGNDDVILSDCGGNLIWTMQGLHLRGNQRLISAFNHSPMGYSFPASIGAAFGTKNPITCITGDGGFEMNIQELATIQYNKLPVRIFVMNNHGHGIIKQTLRTWLKGNYTGVDSKTGLADVDFEAVANAYKIPSLRISNHSELSGKIEETLNHTGPVLCNVQIAPEQEMLPKLVFGRPIEDSAPLLSRQEFNDNMLVPPIEKP